MKRLEQYIEANAIYEELVNMTFVENDVPVEEGLFDFLKKLAGKFSKAKTAVKATGNVMTKRIKDWYKDAFPEWWKEYEKLSQEEDEKKRVSSLNNIIKQVEGSDSLSDEQKAEIKMILLKQQADLSKAAGQEESAKAAEEQLKKTVQDNPEAGKKVTSDLKGAGYKAPEGEGGDEKIPPTVQKASEKTDELQQNVDTLSEKDPEVNKTKQELDKAQENDNITSSDLKKYMEEMFSRIDNSETLSDTDKIAEKLNLVMLQLSMFGLPEDDDKHRDISQFKEYYNYLTKTLNNLNQENKEATKQYLDSINKGEVPEASTEGEEGDVDPVKQLATEHKPTLQDISKLGDIDEKTLQGIQAKVKAFVNTSEAFVEKLNNIIVEAGEDIKDELKSDDKAQSLFSIILVAYYGLKKLKLIDNIDDLAEWLKLIESQEVKEGRISLKDYIEKL